MEYLVEWHIHIEAESHEEAAEEARAIQLDPRNTANHFYVTAEDDSEAQEVNVPL